MVAPGAFSSIRADAAISKQNKVPRLHSAFVSDEVYKHFIIPERRYGNEYYIVHRGSHYKCRQNKISTFIRCLRNMQKNAFHWVPSGWRYPQS